MNILQKKEDVSHALILLDVVLLVARLLMVFNKYN